MNNTLLEKNDLVMNPFSFKGRSGRLNFLVYGILPIIVLFILGYYIHNPIVIGLLLFLGVAMFFATLTRRGRDAGMAPVNSIGSYIFSVAIISTLMGKSLISLKIISMFQSEVFGMIIIALITNIFLIYLLFAAKSNKEIPKSSVLSKIILGFLGLLIVFGLGAAVIAPMLNMNDTTKKISYYEQNCDGGDAASCNILGISYLSGLEGLKPDMAKALKFYEKACSYGSMDGCTRAGVSYNMGAGVPKDYAIALSFFKKGCDGGNPAACANAGISYEFGEGTTKNTSTAKQYYKKACNGGNKEACKRFSKLSKK
jgi:uncharacterized membrane protein YhaH (DUF805 family)